MPKLPDKLHELHPYSGSLLCQGDIGELHLRLPPLGLQTRSHQDRNRNVVVHQY
jgi:hypothetical protein